MPFTIEFSHSAATVFRRIRVYDQRRIADEIDAQLLQEPTKETRNRKRLPGVASGFEHVPPLWELRIGEFRAFYDVDGEAMKVHIRAIRRKLPGQTTQ